MAEKSGWDIFADTLNTAIQGGVLVLNSKYQADANKEAAKVQAGIESTTAKTTAEQEKSNTIAKNIVLVVGATLGLVLVFGIAKKILK